MTSVGKDLVTIRKHLGLEIEDVFQETRIPLDTLKRIEDDTIFSDSSENPIYVRSFVRTYTRALKIDDDIVLKSLDQLATGNYNGLLLESYPGLVEKKSKPSSESRQPDNMDMDMDTDADSGPEEAQKVDTEPPTAPPATPAGKQKKYKSETAAKSRRNELTSPPVESVDWAEVGHKFSTLDKSTPVWIVGGIIILIIVFATFYFIYSSDLLSGNNGLSPADTAEPPPTTEPGGSGLSLNLTDEPPEEQVDAALEETLFLTLYAAYDKLEPVRVWSDLKPRIDPYWLEQGTAFNFEFRDSIRVSGQYNRMLMFLNGHRIDNFRQIHYNQEEAAVELTRGIFTPESRWASPIPLELPEDVSEPDTIQNRPGF